MLLKVSGTFGWFERRSATFDGELSMRPRLLSRVLYVNNGMATISSYALKVVREREVVDL